MNEMTIGELLVQQTEKATRLEDKLQEVNHLAETCKDMDEFRRELDRLNRR